MRAILTAFFNKHKDTQRNVYWDADPKQLQPLIESIKNNKLIVFTDCLNELDTDKVQYKKVETTKSPYFERWFQYYQYLEQHPELDQVFCVDATDVVMLNDPFPKMQPSTIYVGDENEIVGCWWSLEKHPAPFLQEFMKENKDTLLNIGLLGGDRSDIMNLISDFIDIYNQHDDLGETDMAVFNYLLYTKYFPLLSHGEHVNTKFKKYETDNNKPWFRHK